MNTNYEHIYYRGLLNFCNYTCHYCPFSKKKYDEEILIKDKGLLDDFYDYILSNKPKTVFLLPYGEGLIHQYYMDFLCKLTKLDFIEEVGIQTNGSFSLEKLSNIFEREHGKISKLKLWCSFHPSEISLRSFADKMIAIYSKDIDLSVGVVGNPKVLDTIEDLRNKLPDKIYLWINKMDGMKRDYTKSKMDFFLSIDPYFNLELDKLPSNSNLCHGGKDRIFMDSTGKKSLCNVSKSSQSCKSKTCSCYLAYSNRMDIKPLNRFEKNGVFRILKEENRDFLFFDIDGTLTKNEDLDLDLFESLNILKEDRALFLNTSLPFQLARKKLGKFFYLFEGGIFSNGGDIRFFKYDYQLSFTTDDGLLIQILKDRPIKFFLDSKDKLYKIMIFKNTLSEAEELEIKKSYSLSKDEKYTYICNKLVDKEKAIHIVKRFYLLNDQQISFFGNSENDILKNKDIENIIVNDNLNEILNEKYFKNKN